MKEVIPKVIHYCWFGRGEKPKIVKKCINSWKTYCPDYQIIEWNEDNYEISNAPTFVQQAMDEKKWAFATDYIRLWIVYEYGGIYLDTDVEIIKPIDFLRENEVYFGMDIGGVSTGLGFGACRGEPFLLELMEVYEKDTFKKTDGGFNILTCTERELPVYMKHGFINQKSEQILDGRIHIYPDEFFAPCDYFTGFVRKTRNTVSIHWYTLSWREAEDREKKIRNMKANRIDYLVHFPNRVGMRLLGEGRYRKLKKLFHK